MHLVNWTPFRDMEGVIDRYQDMFARSALAGSERAFGREFEWRPNVDISESKKEYLIKAELPDIDKDDVDVSVENGLLTISGERHFESDEETETQHRVERMYGKFSRRFALPSDIDESKISAKSKNGVLKVRIPKSKESTEQPVHITVS